MDGHCEHAMPAKKRRKEEDTPLEGAARAYAQELKKANKGTKKMKSEHCVEVLTRIHSGSFPVAVNSYTRPTVCRVLKEELGAKLYETSFREAQASKFIVPELPKDAPPNVEAALPSLSEIRGRFPLDAEELKRDGAQRVPLLSASEVASLTHLLSDHALAGTKSQRLDISQGNGYGGEYATLPRPLPEFLARCMHAACEWILESAGPLTDVLKKKTIGGKEKSVSISGGAALRESKALLLRYGLGGVNFAHRDACGDFQALLMLSQPGIDFTGGEFYLAEATPPHSVRHFPFTAAGELLVFRGRKGNGSVDYMHGMSEVRAGSAAVTRRAAVGLFQ